MHLGTGSPLFQQICMITRIEVSELINMAELLPHELGLSKAVPNDDQARSR